MEDKFFSSGDKACGKWHFAPGICKELTLKGIQTAGHGGTQEIKDGWISRFKASLAYIVSSRPAGSRDPVGQADQNGEQQVWGQLPAKLPGLEHITMTPH